MTTTMTPETRQSSSKFVSRRSWLKTTVWTVVILAAVVWVSNRIIVTLVQERVYKRQLIFIDETPLDALRDLRQQDRAPDDGSLTSLTPTRSPLRTSIWMETWTLL